MIEVEGNLWSFLPEADARVITTNGVVRADGKAVMGRGCAAEAARMIPGLQDALGKRIREKGNHVHVFYGKFDLDYTLITFPTKNHWHQNSDVDLIFRSACELADEVDEFGFIRVVMPRPGCGMGKLNWRRDVKPMFKNLLDDRFFVVHLE